MNTETASTDSASRRPLKIGELAEASRVGIETIRYYERRGLMPKTARTASGYRMYDEEAIQRLAFIRRAQNLGFSLDEIAKLLSLQDGGSKAEVRELALSKLTMIEEKLSDLQRMQDILTELVGRCSGRGSVAGCPILEALDHEAEPNQKTDADTESLSARQHCQHKE